MFNTLLQIIGANLLVSLTALLGGVFLFYYKRFTQKNLLALLGFASGVMLANAILDLLHESIEITDHVDESLTFFLVGIVGFYLLERFLFWHHHHANHTSPRASLVIFGDSIHNFLDGIAIAIAFTSSTSLGIATTIAIMLHEIPQEFADMGVLISSGFSRKKALAYNFLSALFAVLGGLVGFFLGNIFADLHSQILALVAGMFVYIACADLIPELHNNENHSKWLQVLPMILGVLLIAMLAGGH